MRVCLLAASLLLALSLPLGWSQMVDSGGRAAAHPSLADVKTLMAPAEGVGLPERGPKSSALTVVGGAIQLSRRYRFPICAEWDVCRPAGHAPMRANLAVRLDVATGEALSDVLAHLVAQEPEHYVLDFCHGVPCLLTVGKAANRLNTLDTVIDLDLRDASLWKALQTVQFAVNRRVPEMEVPLASVFYFRNFGLLKAHLPKDFESPGAVNLRMTGVSAREALCALIATSPVKFQYTYENAGIGELPEHSRVALEFVLLPATETVVLNIPGMNAISKPFGDDHARWQAWVEAYRMKTMPGRDWRHPPMDE